MLAGPSASQLASVHMPASQLRARDMYRDQTACRSRGSLKMAATAVKEEAVAGKSREARGSGKGVGSRLCGWGGSCFLCFVMFFRQPLDCL